MLRTAIAFNSALFLIGIIPRPAAAAEPIDFSRQIRPILAKNCFACHGPDEEHRQAGLRLDDETVATASLKSGNTAVVPAKPDESELYRRITADDASLRMPPTDSGHHLEQGDIDLLRRWIEAGAPYAQHWSFVKPERPPLPAVNEADWARNGIDHFILARLEREGLKPSPEADRHTLIRRLSLDLRGLPPTPQEVEEFLGDASPRAYERLVERFLADPAYGERWARMWLDLARYADSSGYGSDPLRPNVWRYRDWVIDAFNRNLPYDQFTIEQIAGDLLPEPTLEQRIATAFHRNTMTNTEGGTDDEEFRVAAVKDRAGTTMQVWMGLTANCAQCHNHKFDPISQREYYQLYAIFNQTADTDKPDEQPTMPAPTPDMLARAEQIGAKIAELNAQLEKTSPELTAEQRAWEASLLEKKDGPLEGRFVRIELPGKEKILSLAEVQVFSGETNIAPEGKATQSSVAFEGAAERAIDGNTNGDYFGGNSTTHTNSERNPWWELNLGDNRPISRIVIWNRTDGGLHTRLAKFRVQLLDVNRKVVAAQDVAEAPNPSGDVSLKDASSVPADVLAIVKTPATGRSDEQEAKLAAHYRTVAPSLKPIRDQIAKLEKSKPQFPPVPVMQELPSDNRRETHVMLKGNFLAKGEKVEAAVPAAFHPLPADRPVGRLALAKWLVDPENPLTARVAVNRFWSQIFGIGLVETEEDFGTQGDPPSHPELLDWLAVEFMSSAERGARSAELESRATDDAGAGEDLSLRAPRSEFRAWTIKRLLRLIVTSSTYRQSSRVTPELLEKDPRNRLLSRAPRYRLEAEMVRDQALALSGLLTPEIGGPSVYPPQPDGLWRAAFNGQRTWATSKGSDRYRRGLYTFWRRTIPYPSMAAFDAPSREICTVRRVRTNTPLQAFVTLNDPCFVECAQALARRIMREGGTTSGERVAYGLQVCLARLPQPGQIRALVELYEAEFAHYSQNTDAAVKLATEPLGPLAEGMDAAEAAAWTVVANVLLNLDGVLTKN